MSKHDYFHSTPNDILIYLAEKRRLYKLENENKKNIIQYHSWLTGLYVKVAIGSSLSKKTKYPDKPYDEPQEEVNQISIDENSTLEERIQAEENVFKSLELIQKQCEIAEGK